MEFTITSDLNSKQKKEALEIFWDAFSKKISYFWLFEKNRKKAIECLYDITNFNRGIYVLNKDQKVLGVLGLEWNKNKQFNFKTNILKKYYGLFGSLWRVLCYKLFSPTPYNGDDELYLHSIVVSSETRGMGVGTILLKEIENFALKNNFKKIVLEVIDTNPRAKKLYESSGYKDIKVENTGSLTKKMGFSKVFIMRKNLSFKN